MTGTAEIPRFHPTCARSIRDSGRHKRARHHSTVLDLIYIDPDPCTAQIRSEQISWLQDWFGGNNESEACQSSLKRWDVLGGSVVARVHVPTMASLMFVLLEELTTGLWR